MLILPGLISSETSGIWFRDIGCKLGPPLLLYMACHVVIILYTLLYLPESLGKENRKKKFGLEFLLRGFKILLCGVKEYKSSMWKVWAAFLPMIVQATVSISSTSVTILFLKTLDWDSDLIGAYFAALLGSAWLAIVVVLPILVVLKFPDFLISLIGVLFGFLTNSFLGFARETYQLFILVVFNGLDGMVVPPMRGLMSKIVSAEDKGALFSVVGSIEGAISLVSVLFLYLFPLTSRRNLPPGTVFVIIGVIELVAVPSLSIFLIVWCWNKFKLRKQPREDQNEIMLLEVSRDGELSHDESHDDKDTLESSEE